ncbi:MAG: sigma-70 family RNA polymerase sigma factor [Caldilineaceae bacterium]
MHRNLPFISSRVQHPTFLQKRKEKKFIGQLCAGHPGAWVQLIDQWSPRLYSYVSYNVSDEDETRRLIHLILSEVIQTIIHATRMPNLTVLIFATAYHHVQYHRRHSSSHPAPQRQQLSSNNISSETSEHKRYTNFTQQFQQLPTEVQQLLLLRYVCGVSLPDLSQILGQSEKILAQMLYRARLYLE